MKSREEALSQNQKDFNEAVKQYNADCATAKTFYENHKLKLYLSFALFVSDVEIFD